MSTAFQSRTAWRAAREICAHRDDATLVKLMTERIAELVDCDGVWFNSLDLRTGRHCWEGFHGRRCVREEHSAEEGDVDPALAAHLEAHPLLRRYAREGWLEAARLSDLTTQGRWLESALYREYYHEYRVRYQAGFSLAAHGAHFVGITLNRTSSTFTGRNVRALRELQPWCARAFRGGMRRAWWASEIRLLEESRGSGLGLVLLSRDGAVEWMNEEADGLVAHWHDVLPDVIRRRMDDRPGAPDPGCLPAPWEPEWQTTLPAPGGRVVCHLIQSPRPALIVQCEHGALSQRERNIARWVGEGKTNREIGLILGCSARTVDKHLEHILKKWRLGRRIGVIQRVAATV